MKVFLDRQFVPFGSTVLGNTATSRLLLCNSGDLAVRFTWEVKKSIFAISPAEGYSVPGSNITLTVSYTPEKLQADVCCQAICTLSNHGKLTVELSGTCVDVPPPLMTISLSCPVRQTATTEIPIFNKFGQEVTLSASISGEYFSGDKVASLPPYGTQLFKIKYAPMKVITPPQLHKGTALFYLMDGSCLVYVLEGFATPPAMAERLQVQLPTHTSHTLIILVHNWLQVPQKLLVTHSLESSSEPVSRYKLSYHPYLMVSGSKTRELSLTLTSYLPGTLTFKIMLTNESTEEYEWYEVVCEVHPCGPLADISLTTTVRQPVYHDLVVRNPLDSVISVGCIVDVPGLTVVVNTPLSVYPLQQGIMRLQYLPLWPCESSSNRLELTSEQLGVLPYTVKTTALPPPPGPSLNLTCDLGLQASAHIQLRNFSSLQAIFECASSHEDVTVESPVTVDPGESKSVNVVYQPSSLTNISTGICATSLQAGDFLFPVIGTSLYPEPRGPYTLTPGSNVAVSIKNIFKEAKTFIFSIDNGAFLIKEPTLHLQPNQVVEVTVEMAELEGKQFPQYPETGKLTVSVTDEALCHIQWVFYLCGLLNTSRSSS
ncbi:hydrocephalus-inducing protein-like isoform X1 [Homalodisca vitripennis]|uniref:hydrocephalus-inducing protein-like isoform X1 n=1 Tax=Homalodisca vitripennis TaxID=197043 RepID=UPI001EEB1E7E|nr:hydrocephalus-inducing protein-like isoform X1 [Homalodisca vitripennis]